MASKPIDPNSPRRTPTEGLNTDRYYAAHTRTVINRRSFSERRGRPTSPMPAPRPPMVFPDKSTNSNKYYQENFGQTVRPIGTPISQPAAKPTEPPPVQAAEPVEPLPPVPDAKPAEKAAAKPTDKPAAKPAKPAKVPERPKVATFSLRSGEQLPPVVKNVIEMLNRGESVTVEAKSKTLLGDFDQLTVEAAIEAGFRPGPIETLVRKLSGKTQPSIVLVPPLAADDANDDGFGDLDADEMRAVVEADDPETVLERIDKEKAAGTNEGAEINEEPDGFGDDYDENA